MVDNQTIDTVLDEMEEEIKEYEKTPSTSGFNPSSNPATRIDTPWLKDREEKINANFPQMVFYDWEGQIIKKKSGDPKSDKKPYHFPYLFKIERGTAVLTERLGDLSSYGLLRHRTRWMDLVKLKTELKNGKKIYFFEGGHIGKVRIDSEYWNKKEEYLLRDVIRTIENLGYQFTPQPKPQKGSLPLESYSNAQFSPRDDPSDSTSKPLTADRSTVKIDNLDYKISKKRLKDNNNSENSTEENPPENERLVINEIVDLIGYSLNSTYKVRRAGLHIGWGKWIDKKIMVNTQAVGYDVVFTDMYTRDGVKVNADTRFTLQVRNNPEDLYRFAVKTKEVEKQLQQTIFGFVKEYTSSLTSDQIVDSKKEYMSEQSSTKKIAKENMAARDILSIIRKDFAAYMVQWGFELTSAIVQDYELPYDIENAFKETEANRRLVKSGLYEGERQSSKIEEIARGESSRVVMLGEAGAKALKKKAEAYQQPGGQEVYKLDTAKEVASKVNNMNVVSSGSFVDDLVNGVVEGAKKVQDQKIVNRIIR